MNQIAQYLRGQLSALQRQIERTPPKKHTSLAKIESLVRTAPIDSRDKESLQKEIKHVQAALTAAWTPSKTIKSTPKRKKTPSSSILQMSQEPKGVKDLLRAKIYQQSSANNPLQLLQKQYEELKKSRLSKQKYLQELIVKVHRLQRIHQSRTRSAHSLKQAQLITQQYRQKQKELSAMKEGAVSAARQQRKEVVQRLMRKYCEGVEELGKKTDRGDKKMDKQRNIRQDR